MSRNPEDARTAARPGRQPPPSRRTTWATRATTTAPSPSTRPMPTSSTCGGSDRLRCVTTDGGATWVRSRSMPPATARTSITTRRKFDPRAGSSSATTAASGAGTPRPTGVDQPQRRRLAITTFNGISQHPTNPDIVLGGSQDNGTESSPAARRGPTSIQATAARSTSTRTIPTSPTTSSTAGCRSPPTAATRGSSPASSFPGLYFSFVVDPINSSRLVIGGIFVTESLDGGQTFTNLVDTLVGRVQEIAISSYQGRLSVRPDLPASSPTRGPTPTTPTPFTRPTASCLVVTKDHAENWTPASGRTAELRPVPAESRASRSIRATATRYSSFARARPVAATTASSSPPTPARTGSTSPATWSISPASPPTSRSGRSSSIRATANSISAATRASGDCSGGTGNWDRFGVGMPNVQVKELDLNLNLNILTAGTYGRSAFQFYLDDVQADSGAMRATSGISTWTGPVRLPRRHDHLRRRQPGDCQRSRGRESRHRRHHQRHGRRQLRAHQGRPGNADLLGHEHLRRPDRVAEGVLAVNNPDALGTFRAGADITAQGGTIVEAGATLAHAGRTWRRADRPQRQRRYARPQRAQHRRTPQHQRQQHLHRGAHSRLGCDHRRRLGLATHRSASPGSPARGTIIGGFDLTKELTGTLILASDNSGFTGGTTVNPGRGADRAQRCPRHGPTGAQRLDGGQIQLRTPPPAPTPGQPVVGQCAARSSRAPVSSEPVRF